MNIVSNAVPLYRFLKYCNESPLERVILDCGAGGEAPPLSLFYQAGYKTFGVDVSEERIALADEFARAHNMTLNIRPGSITRLPFEDESMSFVYSYKTIYHMTREETAQAIAEIERVMKKNGLCFINFLSGDDPHARRSDIKTTHRFYDETEADEFFHRFDILFKERRITEKFKKDKIIKKAFIDYIVKKK